MVLSILERDFLVLLALKPLLALTRRIVYQTTCCRYAAIWRWAWLQVSSKRSKLAQSQVKLLGSSKYSILMVGSPILTRITTSVMNTKLNEVSMVDTQGVVRYTHSIPDSSSAHLPLDSSNFIPSP